MKKLQQPQNINLLYDVFFSNSSFCCFCVVLSAVCWMWIEGRTGGSCLEIQNAKHDFIFDTPYRTDI